MPALNQNEKVKCEDLGNMFTRINTARNLKRCVKGVVSCPECKYSTYNQQEMSYHMAKKHAEPSSKQSTVCSSCDKSSPVITPSNNIGERNMEQNNGNPVIRWPT